TQVERIRGLRVTVVRKDERRNRWVVAEAIHAVDGLHGIGDRIPFAYATVTHGIAITPLHDLVVLQRVAHQKIVVATGRRRDAGSDIQLHLPRSVLYLLRLDDHHAVAGPRPVNRRRRRVFQDLDFSDVVGTQPVEVGVLGRRTVDDVQRIVVLERSDAPDPDGGARAGRAAGIDRDTGHAAIQPLQHTGRGLLLEVFDIDRADRAGDVGRPLRRVTGDDDLRQHGDGPVQRDIDRGPSGDALRGTAEPDEVERQDPIPRSRDRVAPLRIGGGTGRAPPDADGHAGNGMTLRRGDFAGDLDLRRWLLAQCSSAHGQGEQHTQPHRAEEVEMPGREPTLTLQHVVHGGALILRVVAWP